MAVISASTFKSLVARRQFEKIERNTVTGEVSYRGEDVPRGLRLLYVTFLGPVDFSDAGIAGTLDLTGCRFSRTLALANAEIDGDLILDEVVVEALARRRGGSYDWEIVDSVLDAQGIAVRSGLSAQSLGVFGHVDLSNCRVDAGISMIGCEIRGQVDIGGAEVGGDLALSGCEVRGLLNLRSASVGGNLRLASHFMRDMHGNPVLRAMHVGDVIHGANLSVKGNLELEGITVDGDLHLWSASIEGNVFIRCTVDSRGSTPALISGDLHLGASIVRGHVELAGLAAAGAVKLYSSTIGPLRIGHHTDTNAHQNRFVACRMGALWAQGLTVHGDSRLYQLQVTGVSTGGTPAVDLTNVTIEGDLRFWGPSMFDEEGVTVTSDAPETSHSNVVGDMDMTGATIEGFCDLTNVVVDGTISLDDARVKGDVQFNSVVSLLASLRIQERARGLHDRLVTAAKAGAADYPRASARRLSLAMLQCDNDVDLTGLALRATESEVTAMSGYGSLAAHGLRVAGDLWMYRRLEPERWQSITGGVVGEGQGEAGPECDAVVPGSARFQGATIGHLSVSGRSFQQRDDDKTAKETAELQRGLVLTAARIQHLEIKPVADEAEGFPVPVNLADVEVGRWDLKENDANRCDFYEQLLYNDRTTRRSTYIAVERSLRNQGLEAEADRIYRAMVRRVARDRPRRWRDWVLSSWLSVGVAFAVTMACALIGVYVADMTGAPFWMGVAGGVVAVPAAILAMIWILRVPLWDWLLGFGTTPMRIGVGILAVFVVMVPLVYWDCRNIGPTIDAELVTTFETGSATPPRDHCTDWGLWDAVAIGLRTHVPIVAWDVRDEWQLADGHDQKLHFAGWKVPLLRPEDFGMIMTVLNFIAWPPFLAFALRRAFRYA